MNWRSTSSFAIGAAVLLANASPAMAQETALDNAQDAATKARAAEANAIAEIASIAAANLADRGAELVSDGAPVDRSMAGFRRASISFDTDREETDISLAFSFDLQASEPVALDEDADSSYSRFRVSRTKIGFIASAPIEEGEESLDLFRGDSLVTGTKLRLSVSRLTNTLGNGAEVRPLIPQAYRACINQIYDGWRKNNADDNQAIAAYDQRLLDFVNGPIASYQIALENFQEGAAEGSLAKKVYRGCVPGNPTTQRFNDVTDLVRESIGEDVSSAFYDKGSVLRFMGVEATAGVDSYSYLDGAAFELADTNRTSWEVAGYYGFITSDSNHSLRGKAVFGKTWELPDETELCRTFSETMEESCLVGADGLPVSKHAGIFSLESRHRFELIDGRRIALAPQATYRLDDDSFGLEVPVYLTANEDGNLTGGIKFGYNTKDDDIAIGLFVGVPFNVQF